MPVDRDDVLHESNQDFEPAVPKVRGMNWTRPEKANLFIACNARRQFIKGAFQSPSGGNESRVRAWIEVAGVYCGYYMYLSSVFGYYFVVGVSRMQ